MMKKTLVALAAVAATATFAQNVSITGFADVGYGTKAISNVQGINYGKTTGVMDGTLGANRIAITVTEDLGGGLKAGFYNEHGISPTNVQDWASRTGAPGPAFMAQTAAINGAAQVGTNLSDNQIAVASQTASTNRNTWVSLSGGFGEVRAGYTVGLAYNATTQSGFFFGMEQFGATTKDWGITEAGSNRANGVWYISPKLMNNFTVQLQKQYGAERTYEGTGTLDGYVDSKAERTAFRVDYDMGDFKANFVRTDFTSLTSAGTPTAGASVFGVAAAAVVATDYTTKHDALNAMYTVGGLSFAVNINNASVDAQANTTSDRTLQSTQLGVQYASGPYTLFGIYGKGTSDSTTNRVSDITNSQFGLKYALSKRTTAYVATGETNDSQKVNTGATFIGKGTFQAFGVAHAF